MRTKEKAEEKRYFDQPQGEVMGEQSPKSTKERTFEEDEIDLVEVTKSIWQRRKIVFITTAILFVLGVLYAFLSPLEYQATTTLMPQSDPKTTSLNSGLLRQFGGFLDLGGMNGSGSLSTNLYPSITESTPFYLHIMKQELYFSSLDTTATVLDYFTVVKEKPFISYVKTYTIGLPGMLLSLPNKLFSRKSNSIKQKTLAFADSTTSNNLDENQPLTLSGREISVINELRSRIKTEIQSDGTVKVTAKMPDPYATASITEFSVDYLTNYISEYRVKKAQQNLEFTEKQYNEANDRYRKAQEKLAMFRDRNSNIVTARAATELERLQTESSLTANVYQGLAQQLEQARIKVQEETPVFITLEPVQVPLQESEPNKNFIMISSIFLGIIIGTAFILGRVFYIYFKSNFLS